MWFRIFISAACAQARETLVHSYRFEQQQKHVKLSESRENGLMFIGCCTVSFESVYFLYGYDGVSVHQC